MDKDKKLQERQIRTDSPFLRWLDNFWYHYKWLTIAIAFFGIVVVVCTVQMCSNEEKDLNMVYAGPYLMDSTEAENFRQVMNQVMPQDFDENGTKTVGVVHYQIYSEEQIRKIESETDEAGVLGSVNRSLNSSNFSTYTNYIGTGDSVICFLDPSLFSLLRENDRLRNLEEALGYLPDGALDAYGVRLGDTALYEQYSSVRVLPEDTVICLLRQPIIGENKKDDNYEKSVKMMDGIVSFGKENEG